MKKEEKLGTHSLVIVRQRNWGWMEGTKSFPQFQILGGGLLTQDSFRNEGQIQGIAW